MYEIAGHGLVSDMVLTGRRLDAQEALGYGVVSRVVEPDDLLDIAREMAERIAASPVATAETARWMIRKVKTLSELPAFIPEATEVRQLLKW